MASEGNILDFETERALSGDHLVRGTAADGMVRAIAITARDTVEAARQAHDTAPVVTAALGRLMMAGQMMGALFKNPDELITLIVKGSGPIGSLTVTANNAGQVKGFPKEPHVWLPLDARGKLPVGAAVGPGELTVVRDMPGAEPYSSTTELVTGEIGDDLADYFVRSDQVPTAVGVGVLVDRDWSVRQAGGFIVQPLPGATPDVLDALEANLAGVDSVTDMLEAGLAPRQMLDRILAGMGFRELDVTPAEFHCGCNEERALRCVSILGPDELRDMIEKGEPAEVHCHFCGTDYRFGVDELEGLLSKAVG